jgi:ubiquinone/menaquinone biosynthesis C-methylase UbiE
MPIHYTDPTQDVPPGVDFQDAAQVAAWVAACEVDKPWRVPMRQRFAELIAALPHGARVLEIGAGPGLLAEAVLANCPNVGSYTVLDFSSYMLELARNRLAAFSNAEFVQGDFKEPDWTRALTAPFTAVLAMQAVHEIRHKRHVLGLYGQLRTLLEPGGFLAVCDGVPRDPGSLFQVYLYMTRDEQVDAFAKAGFEDVSVDREIPPVVLVVGRRA